MLTGQEGAIDGQGYEHLKAQCLEDGQLWEDPEFPATDASLYYENCPVEGEIEWKRPKVSMHFLGDTYLKSWMTEFFKDFFSVW